VNFYGNYPVYSESGVDLTLLQRNLRRSVEERWQANASVLPFLDALRASNPHASNQEGPIMDLNAPALIRRLAEHKVNFVLVGGLAMIAQGSAYITKDLDICYARQAQNIAALAAALAPLHPYLRGAPPGLPFRFDVPTIQAGLNFTLTTDFGDLDVLGEISGIGDFEQALGQSEERTIYGLAIRVLTLDGLIAAKKAAGRTKDRNHLLELEELKKLRDAETGGQP
jgi:hypothetical protein